MKDFVTPTMAKIETRIALEKEFYWISDRIEAAAKKGDDSITIISDDFECYFAILKARRFFQDSGFETVFDCFLKISW